MADSDQIASIRPRHEAIMTHLVANPEMRMQDVALVFGVTPSWLSVVVNSDIFQAKLAERQDQFFSVAAEGVANKLNTLAKLTLDKMIEKAPLTEDAHDLRENAKLALDRMGYGVSQSPVPAGLTQNNTINIGVSPELLAQARERVLSKGTPQDVRQPALIEASPRGTPETV